CGCNCGAIVVVGNGVDKVVVLVGYWDEGNVCGVHHCMLITIAIVIVIHGWLRRFCCDAPGQLRWSGTATMTANCGAGAASGDAVRWARDVWCWWFDLVQSACRLASPPLSPARPTTGTTHDPTDGPWPSSSSQQPHLQMATAFCSLPNELRLNIQQYFDDWRDLLAYRHLDRRNYSLISLDR